MPRRRTKDQLKQALEASKKRTKKIEAEIKKIEQQEAKRAEEMHRDVCVRVAEVLCRSADTTPEGAEAEGLGRFALVRVSEDPDSNGPSFGGSENGAQGTLSI